MQFPPECKFSRRTLWKAPLLVEGNPLNTHGEEIELDAFDTICNLICKFSVDPTAPLRIACVKTNTNLVCFMLPVSL